MPDESESEKSSQRPEQSHSSFVARPSPQLISPVNAFSNGFANFIFLHHRSLLHVHVYVYYLSLPTLSLTSICVVLGIGVESLDLPMLYMQQLASNESLNPADTFPV